jgi:hypothetical protein
MLWFTLLELHHGTVSRHYTPSRQYFSQRNRRANHGIQLRRGHSDLFEYRLVVE